MQGLRAVLWLSTHAVPARAGARGGRGLRMVELSLKDLQARSSSAVQADWLSTHAVPARAGARGGRGPAHGGAVAGPAGAVQADWLSTHAVPVRAGARGGRGLRTVELSLDLQRSPSRLAVYSRGAGAGRCAWRARPAHGGAVAGPAGAVQTGCLLTRCRCGQVRVEGEACARWSLPAGAVQADWLSTHAVPVRAGARGGRGPAHGGAVAGPAGAVQADWLSTHAVPVRAGARGGRGLRTVELSLDLQAQSKQTGCLLTRCRCGQVRVEGEACARWSCRWTCRRSPSRLAVYSRGAGAGRCAWRARPAHGGAVAGPAGAVQADWLSTHAVPVRAGARGGRGLRTVELSLDLQAQSKQTGCLLTRCRCGQVRVEGEACARWSCRWTCRRSPSRLAVYSRGAGAGRCAWRARPAHGGAVAGPAGAVQADWLSTHAVPVRAGARGGRGLRTVELSLDLQARSKQTGCLLTRCRCGQVRVEGEGLRTVELSLKDLQARFKKHTITATLQCTGNRRDDLNTVKPVKGLEWSVGAPATRASSQCSYAIKADWAYLHGSYDNYVCSPQGAVLVILVAFCCQLAAWKPVGRRLAEQP